MINQDDGESERLLRAATDTMLDPQMLIQALRDHQGRIVDFIFREVNPAACDYLGKPSDEIVGAKLIATLPGLVDSGLLARYEQCVETGAPLTLKDFPYFSRGYQAVRRYDLRCARADSDHLSLVWRDVTERYERKQQIIATAEKFRLIAENSSDVVVLLHDLDIAWVSPSVEAALGAPPEHWIGRPALTFVVDEDVAVFAEMVAETETGAPSLRRLRVKDAAGAPHWAQVHAKAFYDANGDPDGRTASVRIIDAEVAAQEELETIRQRQAHADARYRDLITHSGVPAALIGLDGRFELVNRAMCDFLGYDEAAVLRMMPADVTAPEDLEPGARGIQDLFEGRTESFRAIKQYIHADGHRLWGDLSLSFLRDEHGQVKNTICQVSDITEYVHLQASQFQAEARFRRIMETSAVGTCLTNPDGKFEVVNSALCDFLGYDAEALCTKTWQELTAPANLEADLRNTADLAAGRIDSYRTTKQFIRSDGQLVWGDLSIGCLRDTGGALEMFVAQIVDIDQDMRLRLEREEADARYRDLIENSPLATATTHPAGGISLANKAFCAFLGYRAEELIGMPWENVIPAEEIGEAHQVISEMAAGARTIYTGIKSYIHADGHRVWGDVTLSCTRERDGSIDSIIAQIIDVSAEIELRRKQAEADEQLRLLMENSLVGSAMAAPDGHFLLANDAMCEFLRCDRETLLTRNWKDFTLPGDVAEQSQKITDLLAGQSDSWRTTKQYRCADGSTAWGELLLTCARNDDGSAKHIISQVVDVTEQVLAHQEAEEARREQHRSDALYRRYLECATVGMALTSPDGSFTEVNEAMCEFLGYEADTLKTKSWMELTAPADRDATKTRLDDLFAGRIQSFRMRKRYIHADGRTIWGDLSVGCLRNADGSVETLITQFTDVTDEVRTHAQLEQSRRQEMLASERYRQLTDNSIVPASLSRPDGSLAMVNQAMCDFLGYDADTLLTLTWMDLVAPEDLDEAFRNTQGLIAGDSSSYRGRQQLIHADGHRLTADLSMAPIRNDEGAVETIIAQIVDITVQVEAQAKAEEAQRIKVATDALYRRSVEGAAVGMCLVGHDGKPSQANRAICEFFGYDEQTLATKSWMELTAPEYLDADLENMEALVDGRIDSYEMDKQYIKSTGERIWGHLNVSCVRRPDGSVEVVIGQIIDITDAMRSREQLKQREQQLSSQLASAADYVASLLPEDLHGQVEVSSKYLPSGELGGDCFHYLWLDDRMLKIYMIDVSGHGIRPALLSMSVHNIVRSGSLPESTLINPEQVLGKLNSLFQMEDQDDIYFTMWYGIYDSFTRTLRYASGGHPPAIAFTTTGDDGWDCTVLADSSSTPVGMFADTKFETATYTVPAGCRLMVFSDGVFEIPLADGGNSTIEDLAQTALDLLNADEFSADTVVDRMRSNSVDGNFDDDCSLITVNFD
ncbi:PAS domain S-box protein [Mycolicibacterium sp.]|uniref:SpoIIE family protein phosphatase n=1 Tax=Mycolicibacterium sp. TaxID=2320850 RepID=UPI0028B1C111|nr:PAS domain S-box protein [Mycolicibacterium sp.]